MENLRNNAEMMIDKFITEIGLTKEQTYNKERRAWYWTRGSARIEVFIQEVKFETHSRFFLRVFSPICKVPAADKGEFYRRLLEINDTKLGVKLTILPNSDQVYATCERDIKGMDYDELVTTVSDLEWWADVLDDELSQQFAGSTPPKA
jgi:hypothetical protein